MLNWISNIY